MIDKDNVILAGDIGGTKTNLALFSPVQPRPVPLVVESYPSPEYSSLEELIRDFLSKHAANVVSVCFGIPGPVFKGSVKTTNLPWVVSTSKLRDSFGWGALKLVNDLVATAFSITVLEKQELAELNQGKPNPDSPIGVVAPGTGLGMALMVFIDGKGYPLQSEGGHVEFAPRNESEIALLQHLMTSFHVSVERLASGPGLFRIYSWLKKHRRHTEPSWIRERFQLEDASKVISEAALLEKEAICVESLDMFVSILGAAAGNLALTGMTTRGIYLAGGICPKIMPKLREGPFMKSFTAKGRFQKLLSSIPVHVILNDKAALLGAACCAMELLENQT